jgi:3-hydroxyisobutyrate dehydrogenase-like beta-hydroxyacid dehydrogenase
VPVTGSIAGAENGTLTFMAGGEREVFDRARPYMEILGKKLYYCGGPGMGLHAKLTQNLVSPASCRLSMKASCSVPRPASIPN